jgi:hypothetical protein
MSEFIRDANTDVSPKNGEFLKTKGAVLPNDAFQDMHSLIDAKLVEEFCHDNLFFMFITVYYCFQGSGFISDPFSVHPDLCKFVSIPRASLKYRNCLGNEFLVH